MAKDDPKADPDQLNSIERLRKEPRPDFSSTPVQRKPLPKEIQQTLDNEERFWDVLSSGKAEDSTDSGLRYAAYANRIRTIMLSAHRYVAYTSDIGESFRPVAHPWLVRSAYGISWAYILGDVSYEGYKAYLRNEKVRHPEKDADANTSTALVVPGHVAPIDDYRTIMVQRGIFQSIASMGLPAFTIHSVVRYSGQALKNVKNTKIRTWGPIGLGLAAVPALPYMFDKPIEHATEWLFHSAFEAVGGPQAVGKDPATGLAGRPEKEKEL
ncbi:mitochondrial 18 KDa protein-domain-containing protein [Neohortaea acidophila]|uniref:Mitochondrial fission process protein 1 n=1 Tax=Neohortaea acidophila TaxID=245834 RepID=A0A6A6PY90_9PEZI|nr:mitochondrial 18 KDa protein-domain-containing protein [Neohortaea acidophila]KAF2485168.1 mitochondrial 18 KDa protein-domain-containing protein [Neohortaea acidophila]